MPSLEASEVKGKRVRFLERVRHLIKMTNNNVCPLCVSLVDIKGVCSERSMPDRSKTAHVMGVVKLIKIKSMKM